MSTSKKYDHKTWCYTLNNYTESDILQFKSLTCNRHRCCKEIGENGTPHLQGLITFKRSYNLKSLKKLNPKVHWEPAKTTDAENYCTKGEIIIDIFRSNQGKRSDLHMAINTLLNEGIIETAERHPEQIVKYHKGLEKLLFLRNLKDKPFKEITVIVIYGPPGSGKSRYCRETDPNLYNVPEPRSDQMWFDGYLGQECILLDDFYGWYKYHTLLQLLDGYPMLLPIKGGFTHKNWSKVYITSNQHPDLWYPNIPDRSALNRRLTTIIHSDKLLKHIKKHHHPQSAPIGNTSGGTSIVLTFD